MKREREEGRKRERGEGRAEEERGGILSSVRDCTDNDHAIDDAEDQEEPVDHQQLQRNQSYAKGSPVSKH